MLRSDRDRLEVALTRYVNSKSNPPHCIRQRGRHRDQVLAPLTVKPAIEVEVGQTVVKGDTLLVIEAMKLETRQSSTRWCDRKYLRRSDHQVQQGSASFVPRRSPA